MTNHIRQFESYLQSKGGIPSTLYPWAVKYTVNTLYGPLEVSIHRSDFTKAGNFRKKRLASIFTCFSDFERAKDFLVKQKGSAMNPKWNFNVSQEGGDSKSVWDYCLNLFGY